MNGLIISKISEDQWQPLQKISTETFSDSFRHLNNEKDFNAYLEKAFNEGKIKAELADLNSAFYFCYLNGEITGFLKLNEFSAQTEKMGDHALEIERIYVYKNYHGKGLGKKLMEFSIKMAREKSKSKIWLGVWSENTAAIGFYQKMGFSITGSHSFFMGTDEQLDYIMEMNIMG